MVTMILGKTNQKPLGRQATCTILRWRSVNSMLGLLVYAQTIEALILFESFEVSTGGPHRNRCTSVAYLGDLWFAAPVSCLEQGKGQDICEMGCGYRDLVCNSDWSDTDSTDRLRMEVAFCNFCWIDHHLAKSCISPSKYGPNMYTYFAYFAACLFANDGLRSKPKKRTMIMWSRATWQS